MREFLQARFVPMPEVSGLAAFYTVQNDNRQE